MKRFLSILILISAVVLLSSGRAYEGVSCKCKCHDDPHVCYCKHCAYLHHEDCGCECHKWSDWPNYGDSYNEACGYRYCGGCGRYHENLEDLQVKDKKGRPVTKPTPKK